MITNLEEAEEWFLSNSSGSVVCKKGDEEKTCNCYPEAKEFFGGVKCISMN